MRAMPASLHIEAMILNLLYVYAAWLFVAVMFIWLGSVLCRTTRNTFSPAEAPAAEGVGGATPSLSHVPPRPIRRPRVPLTPVA